MADQQCENLEAAAWVCTVAILVLLTVSAVVVMAL
jgi:hypothetical protein